MAILKKEIRLRTAISALGCFFLIGSYYVVKPIRKPLLLDYIGIEYLHYFYLTTPILTLAAVFLYNSLVSRFSRTKLLRIVSLTIIFFFITLWALLFFLSDFNPNTLSSFSSSKSNWLTTNVLNFLRSLIAGAFFFFGNIYILIFASLFWSLNNDIHTTEDAKKFYPFISFGAQVGVILGSLITKNMVQQIGSNHLLILCAAGVTVTWLLLEILDSFETNNNIVETQYAKPRVTGTIKDVKLFFSNSYVLSIGILTVLSTLGDTLFDYQFITLMERSIENKDSQIAFLAETNEYTGICNIFLCVLVTPFLLRRYGPAWAICLYPLMLFVSGIFLISSASVYTARMFSVALTSILHTLYEVGKEIFYVPTNKIIKYKMKALCDTFIYKLGSAAGSALITIYVAIVGVFQTSGLSSIVILLVSLWIPLILKTGKQFNSLAEGFKKEVEIPMVC